MAEGRENGDSPSEGLTVHSAADAIAGLLSDDSEDTQPDDAEQPSEEPQVDDESPAEPSEEANDEDEAAESPSEDESETPDDPDAPDDEQPTETPPAKVKVKIDGAEHEVTLDEALAGYSRTQDYTRKTQKLAEDRKAFEQEHTATRAARQQYTERLAEVEAYLTTANAEPDWDALSKSNPNEFAQIHAAFEIGQKRIAAIRAERQRAEQEQAAEAQAEFRQHLAKENEQLNAKIPGWKDVETGKKGRAELLEYAKSQGFSPEELGNVADHRALVLLHKAMLHDRAVAKDAADKAKGRKVIERVKTVAPGPSGKSAPRAATELTRRKQRLAQTGDVRAAASALELMLGD